VIAVIGAFSSKRGVFFSVCRPGCKDLKFEFLENEGWPFVAGCLAPQASRVLVLAADLLALAIVLGDTPEQRHYAEPTFFDVAGNTIEDELDRNLAGGITSVLALTAAAKDARNSIGKIVWDILRY
jgi:hypothetical protein